MNNNNVELGVIEITLEDLEFNLEKHKDCEYSENIYEFLFSFEKGNESAFLTFKNQNKQNDNLGIAKSRSLNMNNSVMKLSSSSCRFSVCLKLPEKKNTFEDTINFESTTMSSKKKKLKDKASQKTLLKSPQNLILYERTKKLSPYLSESPVVKNLIIKSPKRQTKRFH